MITTNTGAKKIEGTDNWREIFDAHNDSVDAHDTAAQSLAPIVKGKQCAVSVASGKYVLLMGSTITGKADGAYKATKAIPANTDIDGTYLTAATDGFANSLSDQIVTLSGRTTKQNRIGKTVLKNNSTSLTFSEIGMTNYGSYIVLVTSDSNTAWRYGGVLQISANNSNLTQLFQNGSITCEISGSSLKVNNTNATYNTYAIVEIIGGLSFA